MDNAVALVETYLRVNGFFTITEFPVLAPGESGHYSALTDLDVLAVRFPQSHGGTGKRLAPDPLLGVGHERVEMLIGEVKEGVGKLNRGMRQQAVVVAALERFGCCSHPESVGLVRRLFRDGESLLPNGHRLRLALFSQGGRQGLPRGGVAVSLHEMVTFLEAYLRRERYVLKAAQLKDRTLGFMLMLQKSKRKSAR